MPPSLRPSGELLLAELQAWTTSAPAPDRGCGLVAMLTESIRPHVNALLGPRLRRSLDPEDVLQEVLIAILRSAKRLACGDGSGTHARIRSITRARVIDIARENRARKRGAGTSLSLEQLAEHELWQSSPSDPALLSEQHEKLEALSHGLARLSADQRQAFELHELEGRTTREVARLLGRSSGATRKLIRRARRTLGRRLLRAGFI